MVCVRGAFGPILTTGVALAASAVVVANPVVPARSDVQIPAVQLSAGTGDALGMLDEDFLNAIAPAPPESTNPFVIFRDLITSLAADATYLGTSAIVDAFVAGATAVTQPELTASSVPYVAPSQPAETTVPVLDAAPSLAAYLPPELAVPGLGTADLTPVVSEVVISVINDVSYVGNQLVAAAYAAGAMLAAEPGLVIDTVRALIEGDVSRALETAFQAVVAPLGPPKIIFDAIRTIIERRLVPAGILSTPVAPVSVQAPISVPGVTAAEAGIGASGLGPKGGAGTRRVAADRPIVVPLPTASTPGQSPQTVVESVVVAPEPDSGEGIGEGVSEVVGDVTGGVIGGAIGDVTAARPTARPARSGVVGGAVSGVRDAARAALREVGDTARKATGRATKTGTGRNTD